MSATWLDRLSSATAYAELRDIFATMAAEAHDAHDPRALAKALEEAVVRIERERQRDEEALHAFERDYETFKQDQRGVMGWLKRHLPFSETRRQEKEHKEALADQGAEILGDALFIARAQMLREHLVPVEERSTGMEPSAWRALLAADAARDRLRAYAETTVSLGEQIERSRTFVKDVRADIEAFRKADFASDADEDHQKQDVAAARKELAVFDERAEAEEALRAQALEHLAGQVADDLAARDPAFARLSEDLPRLERAVAEVSAVEGVLDDLREGVGTLLQLEERVHKAPEQRAELEADTRRLQAELAPAQRRVADAEDELQKVSRQLERAVEAEERARTAVRRAQDELSAYLEQTGQFELEPGESVDDATPADAALTSAQRVLQEAHAEVRRTREPHQGARAAAERARKEAAGIERRLQKAHDGLASHEQRVARLRESFDDARETLRPVLDQLPEAVTRYQRTVDSLERTSRLPRDREGLRPVRRFEVPGFDFGVERESDIERAAEHWSELAETLEGEQAALRSDLADAQVRRSELWAAHAERLLGADLARELGAAE